MGEGDEEREVCAVTWRSNRSTETLRGQAGPRERDGDWVQVPSARESRDPGKRAGIARENEVEKGV